MDAATLASVMGNVIPASKYAQYVGPFNDAMIAAKCTNPNRAAMFCAQVGHESVGLKYMEEIASGAAYEGRRDLGNTQKGDGVRFKGRGPIQLTGRANYLSFGRWCRSQGLVDRDTYFTDNPTLVATPKWGFLAASWYWTVARAALNSYADAGNVVAATKAINGGTNGLADRTARWNRARTFGTRLLPTSTPTTSHEDEELTPEEHAMLQETRDLLRWLWSQVAGENAKPFEFTGWPAFPGGSVGADGKAKKLTLVDYERQADVQLEDVKRQLAAIQAKLDSI